MNKPKRKRCPCTSCVVTEDKTVWRKEEFNAGSSNQVKDLLKELGIRIPTKRNKEGETVETTGKKQLQRLAKKNEQLRPILIIRSKRTLRQNYDWNIDIDGRIRTYYGFNPSTWRLSSWYNNLAVIPRRGELSHRVRKLIKAAPGYVLGEVDSAGIEAVLVGYYAKSERFVRLAKAGLHGWLTAKRLGQEIPIDLPFDELQRRCKATKRANPRLYDVIKPIVHGVDFDESAWGIYEQNPEEFESPKEAEELRAFYLSTLPGQDLAKWQEETRQQAHSQRCLQNAYGVKHWFWSVFQFNQGKGIWEPDSSGDGKRCLAFLPQSTAACMNREYALTFAAKYPEWVKFMRLFTYDSISLEWPKELGDEPIRALADVMSMKLPALDGLSIGVEAKMGEDLERMDEIKL